MTDITKYKNVSLSHDTYTLIDKMRKKRLVPNAVLSRAQTINILVNEKAQKLNGISGKRISTISYGKEKPVNPASSTLAWSQNRRSVTVKVN